MYAAPNSKIQTVFREMQAPEDQEKVSAMLKLAEKQAAELLAAEASQEEEAQARTARQEEKRLRK